MRFPCGAMHHVTPGNQLLFPPAGLQRYVASICAADPEENGREILSQVVTEFKLLTAQLWKDNERCSFNLICAVPDSCFW
jgi:hypothetical protein